jgi:RNA polymerase sigma-70 factor (ECF subfamily)
MSLPADRPRPDPLLPRVAAGDAAAVRECIDCYGGLVWSLARRFCATPADAEDAVQDIFIDLWRSAGRYRPEIGSETLFVATVARRRLIDRVRRQARLPASDPVDLAELSDPSSALAGERASEVALAAKIIGSLPNDQRRVLVLGVVHGLTHSEIAERTGLPLGTVKTHLRRGLIRVRDAMRAGDDTWSAGGRDR